MNGQPCRGFRCYSIPIPDSVVGYCGYLVNPETGDYCVRHRVYDTVEARWLQRDPLGYHDGMNLYEYVGSSPVLAYDPMGLVRDTDIEGKAIVREQIRNGTYRSTGIDLAPSRNPVVAGLWQYAFEFGEGLRYTWESHTQGGRGQLFVEGLKGILAGATGNEYAPDARHQQEMQNIASRQWTSQLKHDCDRVRAGVSLLHDFNTIQQEAEFHSTVRAAEYSFYSQVVSAASLPLAETGLALSRIGSAAARPSLMATSVTSDTATAAHKALRMPTTDAALTGTRTLGYTTPNGKVFLQPGLSSAERLSTLRHEAIHAFFSVKGNGPVAMFRQNLGVSGYRNSQLLRYSEEAIAETYGSGSLLQGLRHPFVNGYGITPGGLLLEGGVVGGGIGGAAYLGSQRGK